MMNNQPLNLLSASSQPTGGNAMRHPSSSEQRQLASLTSIFSSLSSLAAGKAGAGGQPEAALATSTLQSVMAAAMLQANQNNPSSPPKSFASQEQQLMSSLYEPAASEQQQQRINYCTICNKELCNKYFMKTHMIKMHGINLEMEPAEGDEPDELEPMDEKRPLSATDSKQELKLEGGKNSQANKPSTPSQVKQQQQQKKKAPAGSQASNSKQATSVLNGFAGNSMGGVVCDICNKELCSKYFLKVHKQNTHGIADYPDAGAQFPLYPFPGAPGNPFLGGPALAPPVQQFASPFGQLPGIFQSQPNCMAAPLEHEKCSLEEKAAKRVRLSQPFPASQKMAQASGLEKQQREEEFQRSFGGGFGEGGSPPQRQQLDSVYRLLVAQQQGAPITAPLLPGTHPAGPLAALMCFGPAGGLAGGPFGAHAAGMSPAGIVDNILRNQHLFSTRNNGNTSTGASKQAADPNNNNSSGQTGSEAQGKAGAKAASSRYFSHYTEACPMCDRRFKSIKWLKTHMMNDHKQEIGAYMQMMLQYMYTSKSQQLAAAATMAALEQQQLASFGQHQQPVLGQAQEPIHLLQRNKCNLPEAFHGSQNQSFPQFPAPRAEQFASCSPPESLLLGAYQSQLHLHQRQQESLFRVSPEGAAGQASTSAIHQKPTTTPLNLNQLGRGGAPADDLILSEITQNESSSYSSRSPPFSSSPASSCSPEAGQHELAQEETAEDLSSADSNNLAHRKLSKALQAQGKSPTEEGRSSEFPLIFEEDRSELKEASANKQEFSP